LERIAVDAIVLALEELSASFYAEILRGRYRRGNFNLHEDFESLYDLEKDCPVLPEITDAEEIFMKFQNAIKNVSKAVMLTLISYTYDINLHTFSYR
jgi:hypothetical protein